MRILVAGGTGFLGRALTTALTECGHGVTLVTRTPESVKNLPAVGWTDNDALRAAVEASDAVINLAGEGVAEKRWDSEFKKQLVESRVKPTATLAKLKPKILLQASAVGLYGDRRDEIITESSPPSPDFFGKLCSSWEAAAQAGPERVCFLRIGQVLGRGGGALESMLSPPMVPLSPWKLGLGGPLGSGKQWMPWIHLGDVVGLFLAALEDPRYTGAVNAVSPNPVTARAFADALGRALGKPALLPVPAFALRVLVGEFTEFLLASQRVVPERAAALGYAFKFPTVDLALADLLSAGPSTR